MAEVLNTRGDIERMGESGPGRSAVPKGAPSSGRKEESNRRTDPVESRARRAGGGIEQRRRETPPFARQSDLSKEPAGDPTAYAEALIRSNETTRAR
jgi:hypothetical protein